jgi:hypothetical protein
MPANFNSSARRARSSIACRFFAGATIETAGLKLSAEIMHLN